MSGLTNLPRPLSEVISDCENVHNLNTRQLLMELATHLVNQENRLKALEGRYEGHTHRVTQRDGGNSLRAGGPTRG